MWSAVDRAVRMLQSPSASPNCRTQSTDHRYIRGTIRRSYGETCGDALAKRGPLMVSLYFESVFESTVPPIAATLSKAAGAPNSLKPESPPAAKYATPGWSKYRRSTQLAEPEHTQLFVAMRALNLTPSASPTQCAVVAFGVLQPSLESILDCAIAPATRRNTRCAGILSSLRPVGRELGVEKVRPPDRLAVD